MGLAAAFKHTIAHDSRNLRPQTGSGVFTLVWPIGGRDLVLRLFTTEWPSLREATYRDYRGPACGGGGLGITLCSGFEQGSPLISHSRLTKPPNSPTEETTLHSKFPLFTFERCISLSTGVLFHQVVLESLLQTDIANVWRISRDAITPAKMPLGIQRLNAKKTQPNDRVVFIKPLKGKDETVAQDFLERIAAQCRMYITLESTPDQFTTC